MRKCVHLVDFDKKLKNAATLAIRGVDTTANEPIKVGKWVQNTYEVKKHKEKVGRISSYHKDIISEVVTRVKGAVHSQMISDVPVGAFLSGGLDSSAIVTFARERNRCHLEIESSNT